MIDQEQINKLLNLVKELESDKTIDFPFMGNAIQFSGMDIDRRESFLFDIQRKGIRNPLKCTFQQRYRTHDILLRLDIEGAPHENPDYEEIPCPHLHICRAGYNDAWAYPIPLPEGGFADTTDLVDVLKEFLAYCKVTNIPEIQRPLTCQSTPDSL